MDPEQDLPRNFLWNIEPIDWYTPVSAWDLGKAIIWNSALQRNRTSENMSWVTHMSIAKSNNGTFHNNFTNEWKNATEMYFLWKN